MEKFISKLGAFALLFSTLLIYTACNEDADPTLSVNKTSLSLQANGDGDKDITVTASHTDWMASVTEGSSWLRVNKNGSLATVSVDVNSTTQTRIGKIKISATGDASLYYDISVNQAGTDGTITVSVSSVEFDPEGGSQAIQITSNSGWNVSGTPSWLTVNPSSGTAPTSGSETKTVTLSVGENTTKDARSCSLVFSTLDNKASTSITVTQKPPIPYIKVNGIDSNNMVFEGGFDGKTGIDYKQTITITSNIDWSASGIPSWLSVSPSNGNGTVQMTIYPISENTSSSDRSATIVLSGNNNALAKIEVTQTKSLATVKVTPSNLVALYNQLGWELKETGKVNKFHWLCVSESEMNRMTDNELLDALLNEDAKKYVDDYMFFPAHDSNGKSIKENTTYYICTVAFDVNDKRGEVVKSKVTTPVFLDGDKDAWVSFPEDDMRYGSSGFQFTAVKEGFCDTYHVIYGNLPSDYVYPSVAFAFEINYYIKNKKKHWFAENWQLEISTYYPNNHTFNFTTYLLDSYPLISIFARGVFKDGTESSDMRGGQWDVSGNDAPHKTTRSKDINKNIILTRSTEQARARRFLKK